MTAAPHRPIRDTFAAVHRVLRRVFGRVAWVLSLPLLGVAYLLVGLVPWLAGIPLRIDPLWAPRRTRSAWVPRDAGRRQRGGDLWLADPAPRRALIQRRRRRILPNALVTVGLLLGAKDLSHNLFPPEQAREADLLAPPGPPTRAPAPDRRPTGTEPRGATTTTSTVPAGPDWLSEWTAEFRAMSKRATASQYEGTEYPDTTGRWLNVRHDVRSSWRAPSTCPRRVRVWAFGGSAMFGLGQRDEHTLPSELARAAWRDGVALDVQNRAVAGDVAWIELARLRRALAIRDAPDLVIFYDGAGDLQAVEATYTSGREVTNRFSAISDRDVTPLLTRLQVEQVDGRQRVAVDVPDRSVRPPDEAIQRDAVRFQYGAARRLTDEELAGRKIASVAFLQPTIGSRTPAGADDPPSTVAQRERVAALRGQLPVGVVDLGDALDGRRGTFTTEDTTDEAANDAVAARMWSILGPVVAGLPGAPAGAPCR